MNTQEESTETLSLRDEAVAFLEASYSGSESQVEETAAAEEGTPDQGAEAPAESAEDAQALDGETGESEEPESKDEGGKKPGRFQKLKQRAQRAETERDTAQSQVAEALDHVAFYQAELQTAGERIQQLEQALEEAGYGFTEEQKELQVLKAKERGAAHYRAAAEAAQKRQAQVAEQAQAQTLKAELDEVASEFGMDWQYLAVKVAQAPEAQSIRDVAQSLSAAAKPAADSPEARQVAKNQAVPAVVNRNTGNVAQQDHKPGSREHMEALLVESGLYR